MENQEIIESIAPIFQRVFNDDELDVNMGLTSDDIDEWSSLSQAILLTEIENKFNIKFRLREVTLMNDVKTIVDSIKSKID